MSDDTTRTCSKCDVTKCQAEFWQGNICKSCNNARMQAYRKANPDKIRTIQARTYRKHRDKRCSEAKVYEAANPRDPERRRRAARERYAADPERARAAKMAWRAANSERVAEINRGISRRRRARLRSLPTEPYTVEDILDRDGALCVLCEEEMDFAAHWPDPQAVSVEHLECLSWPGSAGDVLANVALAHFGCNNRRRAGFHPLAAAKRAVLVVVAA